MLPAIASPVLIHVFSVSNSAGSRDQQGESLRIHPINSSAHRFQFSLGDSTGLTKLGVHLCRLPPHSTSTTLHWHSHEDEWFYILEAGEDARLLIWEGDREGAADEPVKPREEAICKGDFLGFRAGVKNAHALRTRDAELIYLMGGSREPMDMSYYPEVGKRRVTDTVGMGNSWTIEDKDLIHVPMQHIPLKNV